MVSWVYIQSEPSLYTVGFYDPNGQWHGESDHAGSEDAAARVHYLNGGRENQIDKEADAERPKPQSPNPQHEKHRGRGR